jgi:hypothetical protein
MMPLMTIRRLCGVISLSLFSASVHAAETASFPSIIVEDFSYIATAPSRWESTDWQTLGWASLAVVSTAKFIDRPMRDFMCQQSRTDSCPGADNTNSTGNATLNRIENLGSTYSLGVMGGFYLYGALGNNQKSINVAEDLVMATMVSATINQTTKILTNRSRPRENLDNSNFQGFTGLNNNSSFPSGHTTQAFTVASVIATHYEDQPWVVYSAYSVASIVGMARMYNDAHWASDVLTSAFLGTLVGRTIVNHNKTLHKSTLSLLPLLTPDLTGVQLVGNF